MRKHKFLLMLLMALINYSALAQKNILPGHWEGAISRLGSVQLLKFDFIAVGDSIEIQYDDPVRGCYRCYLEGDQKIGVSDSVFDINFGYAKFKSFFI